MKGEKAQLLATDPPYLVNYTGGNHPPSKANRPETRNKDWDSYKDPESSVGFYEHEQEAKDARRLGGIRRRRESVVQGTYDVSGLGSIPELRRLLEIVAVDTLALDNSVARARTMVAIVQAAAKLLELGDFEERLAAIESVMEPRLQNQRRTG
jgi:hypothetical protein